MRRFKKWLRSILSGAAPNDQKNEPPSLPYLPAQRKHIITPRPSSEEDLTEIPKPNGAFFELLPRELRDQIYIAAFGKRIIHIDLQFASYPKLPDDASRILTTHAQEVGNANDRRDPEARVRWAWWSSVCHRHPAWDDRCSHWSLYYALMRDVSYAFPSLTKFYVSVQATIFGYEPPTEYVGLYRSGLLEPMDAMVRTHASRLRDCQIAPNASLYCALERRAEMDGAHVEQGSGTTTTGTTAAYWPRFWRPVIVRPDQGDRTPEQVGYWVRRGRL
ncbi:MAG: hypothetical protein Q9178_001391 [Gyalolechia marmorata]